LTSVIGNAFESIDTDLLVDFQIKMIDLDLQITQLDIYCFFVSAAMMYAYTIFESFVFNNMIAFVFCIHAIQSMFIGNFKNAFMLLTLLFFYDIFFVFGTDVMLTVAKGIDAPIKLKFPKDYSGEKPHFSILGLGDIVIPGIVVSLCLRYDFLKHINLKHFEKLVKAEGKGDGDADLMKYLNKVASECPQRYFAAVNVGYLIAMVCTIVVMFIYDHGQPALLYLVPGCILSISATACIKGEWSHLWEFQEDEFLTRPESEEEQKAN